MPEASAYQRGIISALKQDLFLQTGLSASFWKRKVQNRWRYSPTKIPILAIGMLTIPNYKIVSSDKVSPTYMAALDNSSREDNLKTKSRNSNETSILLSPSSPALKLHFQRLKYFRIRYSGWLFFYFNIFTNKKLVHWTYSCTNFKPITLFQVEQYMIPYNTTTFHPSNHSMLQHNPRQITRWNCNHSPNH